MHGMSLANVASNHALVCYVLPYLPPQLRFDPHILQWVMFVHLTTLGNNFFQLFLLNAEPSLQVLDRLCRRWHMVWRSKGVTGWQSGGIRRGQIGRQSRNLEGSQVPNFACIVH